MCCREGRGASRDIEIWCRVPVFLKNEHHNVASRCITFDQHHSRRPLGAGMDACHSERWIGLRREEKPPAGRVHFSAAGGLSAEAAFKKKSRGFQGAQAIARPWAGAGKKISGAVFDSREGRSTPRPTYWLEGFFLMPPHIITARPQALAWGRQRLRSSASTPTWKLELPRLGPQAGAWEPAKQEK